MTLILAKKITSFKDKTIGLIGNKIPENIFFKTRFGVHTFFMKFPIDVIILDKTNRVKVLKVNLKPNRIFIWNPKYSDVLELPAGTIKKMKIKLKTLVLVNEIIH